MPSCPGSLLRIMQAQAGTVIGGCVLRSGPWHPPSISAFRLGRESRYRSKTRRGAAQSSPMTATFMFDSVDGPASAEPLDGLDRTWMASGFRALRDRRQALGDEPVGVLEPLR